MPSPAVPLTQARSSHASGFQENQRSHPATPSGRLGLTPGLAGIAEPSQTRSFYGPASPLSAPPASIAAS